MDVVEAEVVEEKEEDEEEEEAEEEEKEDEENSSDKIEQPSPGRWGKNALVLKECYAHLRVLLYTFSKECCPLCRRMLHRGMPQLPQGMPHSFKFSTMTYEKHAVARPPLSSFYGRW